MLRFPPWKPDNHATQRALWSHTTALWRMLGNQSRRPFSTLPLFPLLPRKRSCEVELILKRHEVRDSLLPPTFGCLRYKRSVFTPHPPGNTGRSLCLSSMPLRHGAL